MDRSRCGPLYGRAINRRVVVSAAGIQGGMDQMKGLLSTAASRAWIGVAVAGLLVVALVIGLQLIPRLTAGQDVIDAAKPALTDSAVAGELAGTDLVSEYVDLADPLMTQGGAVREVPKLITMIARKTGVSETRARRVLRREAPHTEALLRALPFSGVARERRRLTQYLSSTLNITPEDLQDQLARDFPRLFQMLAELPSVTDGWRSVPGVEDLERFDGQTPVKTAPQLRDYLRDDLVATLAEEKDRFQALAGSGGIGYIPYLLLILGSVTIAFGLLHARWSASHPSGRFAWGGVVAIGALIVVLVGALQYFPRLNGADRTIRALEPAFDEQRVVGTRAGIDFVVQAVRFGDPIVTARGGAAAELPRLVTFVSGQAGQPEKQVRRRLQRAAPRTVALLEAAPLSEVAEEVPHLVAVLSRKLRLGGDRLVASLRRRTPGLARALLAVGPVTSGWDAIPDSEGLARFADDAPVRSMPAFAGYLDEDVIPVLEVQQNNFQKLANTWPAVDVLPGLLLAVGLLVALYGAAMMFFVTSPPARS